MKRFALYLGLAAALVASCSIQEEDFKTPQQNDVIYYASFEQPAEDGTRVYANEDLLLRWTADDRVSIFGKITYNQQYKFLGETGDNSGGFSKVDGVEYVTGNPIPHTVSVYPYQEGTKISEKEVLTLTLPAKQHYAEKTFGLGANTMVSVSEDNVLQYKSVGGFLRLSLYGEGVTVSSITLKGNNGEKLAGKATVTMPIDGTPTVVMADDATDAITLACDTPVALGATAEESSQFWIVVSPVTFSKGFTVSVSGQGGVYEKSTEKTLTIERNNLSKMTPIEVELSQPNNVIFYTSVDGSIITPYNSDAFGASIVSNEYADGVGILTFDGPVTSIGDNAFTNCTSLTGISIPDDVTSIGNSAFFCTSLTSITIPDRVTSIGKWAFCNCTSLASIRIPDGVTSIGSAAFRDCTSLTNLSIPDTVTSIEDGTFSGCTSLTNITLPDSVTSIGDSAFQYCRSLTGISIPDGVTIIGDYAFSGCTSLTSITLPDSVMGIGESAFNYTSLTGSITIPDSVVSLGDGAFSACSSLMSFFGKFASSDGLFLIDSGRILSVAGGSANGDVTISDNVTSIGNFAFSACTSLTSITLSSNVTSIGGNAFSYCTSLTSITIPDSVTSIGDGAFNNCTSLTSITIPTNVTSIERRVFSYCTSLTSITIPGNVTSIGWGAFQDCTSLTNISILPLTPPIANTGLFYNTNNCPIYVPAGSVDEYKATWPWSDYADRILPIIPEGMISIDVLVSYREGESVYTLNENNLAALAAALGVESVAAEEIGTTYPLKGINTDGSVYEGGFTANNGYWYTLEGNVTDWAGVEAAGYKGAHIEYRGDYNFGCGLWEESGVQSTVKFGIGDAILSFNLTVDQPEVYETTEVGTMSCEATQSLTAGYGGPTLVLDYDAVCSMLGLTDEDFEAKFKITSTEGSVNYTADLPGGFWFNADNQICEWGDVNSAYFLIFKYGEALEDASAGKLQVFTGIRNDNATDADGNVTHACPAPGTYAGVVRLVNIETLKHITLTVNLTITE